MIQRVDRASARTWALPFLVLLLVLGHVCELPAYVDLIVASHEAEHSHHADAHDDGQSLSCDVVDLASAPGAPTAGPSLTTSVALAPVSQLPVPIALRASERPARLATGPPLFLLHSVLLI